MNIKELKQKIEKTKKKAILEKDMRKKASLLVLVIRYQDLLLKQIIKLIA